mgnify:FL=1
MIGVRESASVTYPKDELLPEICARLAEGEPLAAICRDPHMPDASTVRGWALADEQVSNAIAQARAHGFDAIADECLEIANTPVVGEEVTTKPDGTQEVKRGDMLGHRKLQIETRLKLLAKWDPKRYGERQAIEHSVNEDTAAILAAARKRAGVGG